MADTFDGRRGNGRSSGGGRPGSAKTLETVDRSRPQARIGPAPPVEHADTSGEPLGIYAVDESAFFIEGLRASIAHSDMGMSVVGNSTDETTVAKDIRSCHPDIVVADVDWMADAPGWLRHIHEWSPTSKTVVLTLDPHTAETLAAVHDLSVDACLTKRIAPDELLCALLLVGSGRRVYDDRLLVEGHPRLAKARSSPLNDVETELLACIAEGLSNRDIARRLSMSTSSVSRVTKQLIRKLDAPNKTQALVEAVRRKLV